MPIILENISVFYSRNTPLEIAALKDVNLRIEKGNLWGYLEKRCREIHSYKAV